MAHPKPWGGRFEASTDARVEAFTSSVDGDKRIAQDDVEGSLAHAQMLTEVGLLTPEEGAEIRRGLETIGRELEANTFPWRVELEDVHMNVETRLRELVGPVAGKLHTARSRNDQVATDARLYTRRMLGRADGALSALQDALLTQAEHHLDTLLPGYTHLQRAQPVRLAHHWLAYFEMLDRDRDRVFDILRRLDRSPLGSGALAGTPHPIARERTAELLGFSDVTANSMDAVSDRDFMVEALGAASLGMIHLSRWCEELVLWSSTEFGFVTIGDGFTTGSSMMPQKKNPDVAELVRGKVGRVVGAHVNLLMTLKALPMTYNRDLQEDKPPLYDGLSTWIDCLEIMSQMIPSMELHPRRMAAALSEGFVTATELADHLVTQGVPFREAHEIVGRLVADLLASGRRLDALSLDELRSRDPRFGEDALSWVDIRSAVERRDVTGGPARHRVVEALQSARNRWSARFDAGRAKDSDTSGATE
ncbi:MAG: argininosuccinate lyase [Myxococcota bacterium]